MAGRVGLPLGPTLSVSVFPRLGQGLTSWVGDNGQVVGGWSGAFAWHTRVCVRTLVLSAWAWPCSPHVASGDLPGGLVSGLGPREAEWESFSANAGSSEESDSQRNSKLQFLFDRTGFLEHSEMSQGEDAVWGLSSGMLYLYSAFLCKVRRNFYSLRSSWSGVVLLLENIPVQC